MKQGWEIKKLGEVCDILDSQRKPVTKKDRKEGQYPYYGATGIQDYVDSYIFDGRYLLLGEDGAKWGAMDKSAFIIEGKCWVNNHAHILKVHDCLIDTFAEYYLVFKDLDEYITGAIVRKLTQQALRDIPILVPPIAEQEKIVAELDCLSGIIEKKKQQLKELDNLAQSIFYEMFSDPVENDKGWEQKTIGSFSKCVAGATPSTKVKEYWDGGTIPWLSSGEVGNGRIYATEKHITQEGYDNASTKLIPPHTVVMALAGQGKTRGTVGVAEIPLCTNQSICSIITNDGVNVDFLYYQLRYLYHELRDISNGDGGRGGLNLKLIQGFKVLVPPFDLQQEFASKIQSIEKQKELIAQSIKETETLFNSRMDYYFN